MNTFKKVLNVSFAAVLLCMTSCVSDDFLAVTEPETQNEGKPITLTVTQDSPATRLELGQDGLSTMWEPGDQLVLVDKKSEITPIFMDCTLTEKADRATFTSKGGVPEGDYWVIYNYNENLAYNHRGFATIDEINQDDKLVLYGELTVDANTTAPTVSLQHLYAKIRIKLKNLPDDNPLHDVTVGMYSTKNGFPLCKMFNKNELVNAEYGIDLNNSSNYNRTYFQSNHRKEHNICFGRYYLNYNQVYDEATGTFSYTYTNLNEFEMNSALVLPGEFSGEDVFFYVLTGVAGSQTCYEIKKENITFEAGKSYAVTLDLGHPTNVTTLKESYTSDNRQVYEVASAAEWRHFAYRNISYGTICKLTEDINFADEYFTPISTNIIDGNGKKLSNIELDWAEDNVGLYRTRSVNLNGINPEEIYSFPCEYYCSISNLTLEDVTFKGQSYVGAFGGFNVSADNCHIIGTSEISGSGDYVGGIVGWNRIINSNNILSKVSIGKESAVTVSGTNYVGGIVGAYKTRDYNNQNFSSSQKPLNDCQSYATVTATGNYAGGIFGKMGGNPSSDFASFYFDNEDYTYALLKCENYGNVSGQNYVGGVGGEFACYSSSKDVVMLEQSLSEGKVSGAENVGGILGSTLVPLNTCYSINTITGTDCVGGIVGKNMRHPMVNGGTLRITNCYSIADLNVGTDKKAGGIIGYGSNMFVMDDGMQVIYMCAAATVANSYFAGTNPQGSGIIGYSEGGCSVTNCLTVLESFGTNLNTNANLPDVITDSHTDVPSILKNINVINKESAYSTNTWPNPPYEYECVKFGNFSTDTGSPDFKEIGY